MNVIVFRTLACTHWVFIDPQNNHSKNAHQQITHSSKTKQGRNLSQHTLHIAFISLPPPRKINRKKMPLERGIKKSLCVQEKNTLAMKTMTFQ